MHPTRARTLRAVIAALTTYFGAVGVSTVAAHQLLLAQIVNIHDAIAIVGVVAFGAFGVIIWRIDRIARQDGQRAANPQHWFSLYETLLVRLALLTDAECAQLQSAYDGSRGVPLRNAYRTAWNTARDCGRLTAEVGLRLAEARELSEAAHLALLAAIVRDVAPLSVTNRLYAPWHKIFGTASRDAAVAA
jgi:hypothetical protein